MHITREQLDLLIAGALGAEQEKALRDHARDCPVCRALLTDYRAMEAFAEQVFRSPLSGEARRRMESLRKGSVRGGTIDLVPLASQRSGALLWAAEGVESEEQPVVSGLMTLASEDPEVVLRLLRDGRTGHDYVQLIAEDSALISHVLVRLPDIDREYLTDISGRAQLVPRPERNYSELKWQIKLPQAVFELEPITPDPATVEHSRSMVLESDAGDAIEVTLTGRAEDKQIALRVLQIDGRPQFGPLRAIVSQDTESVAGSVSGANPVLFAIRDLTRPIHIRLFVA